MFLPVKHPEDLRFRLSRIGIDPGNDTEVVCGYGCLRLLEHIVRLRKWRVPFSAYKNEEVHRILKEVFPETIEAIDRNLEVPDFWKTFANVYSAAAGMPVFRPLIGTDKAEIVAEAHRIGTYDISIEPFEDCCTVFTPRHPRTQPELDKVLAEEAKIDIRALEEEAWAARYRVIRGR